MAKIFSCCTMVSRGMLFMAVTLVPVAAQQAVQPGGDRFQASYALPQIAGTAAGGKKVAFVNHKASSLAAGDFYEDGSVSLATGYAVADGGVIALQRGAPSTAASGGAGLPLETSASLIDVGIRPDLLKAADVNGDGHLDLIVATRGSATARVLLGDGRGSFGAPVNMVAPGRVLALAAWRAEGTGRDLIALGVCGTGCSVALYQSDGTMLANIAVAAKRISVLEVARLNGSSSEDIVVGGGAELELIDGRSALGGAVQMSRLPVSGAVAAVAGSFVYDRRGLPQVAVLTRDGSVHILARAGMDASPLMLAEMQAKRQALRLGQHSARVATQTAGLTWADAETLSSVALPDGGATPLLLRSHISGSGGEDLIALNVNGGQVTTIAHPVVSAPAAGWASGASASGVLPAVVTREAASTGKVDAAIQVRLSQDSRASLVLAQGQAQPSVSLPATFRTINVNTTSDGIATSASKLLCTNNAAGCTLRSALAVVASDAGSNEGSGKVDTVNVPAGNFVLSSNTGLDSQGSVTYHIEIAGPVNIVGAGIANTTLTTNNLDKIFSVNSGVVNTQTGFDVFISNLTMSNGTNPNNYNLQPSSNTYGGLVDWETSGTGYLTFSNCNFTNGTILYGPGGAFYASDTPIGPGTLEVDGGTISGSKTPEEGGGLYLGDDVPMILSGVTITANKADPAVNLADNAAGGSGGGALFGQSNQVSIEGSIVNSVFSSNSAVTGNGEGGGLISQSGLNITNTKFTGNSAGANGGGIYVTEDHFSSTFTGLTVTGNSAAADGGGITVQAFDATSTTVRYSRITGNTTGGAHTGLANGVKTGNQSSTVNAAENFWGCNGAAAGTGCDTAGDDGGTGVLTLTPYVKVSATLSPNPGAVGTALTLSGDLAHDSTGAAIPSPNLTAFAGVSATLNIVEGASSLYSATVPLSSAATASAMGTPTVGGSGTATFKVDNATVSIPFTVIGPPTISSSFGAALIRLGNTTSLSFTLTNTSSSTAQTGVAFTDSLPPGLVVATPNGLSNSCGGTVIAAAGSGSISLSGATIAAGSGCTISLNVLATTAGAKVNTTSSVSSTNGGTGLGTTATLNVNAPVVDTLAFGASSLALNASTTMRYTLGNPAGNVSSLTGVNFSNMLPAGLVIAFPNGASNTCGGTATVAAQTVSLTGATIAVGASCTVMLNVTGKSSGVKNDSFTASSDTIGAGNLASASITVTEPVFASPVSYLTGGTGAGSLMVATADFNGDGVADLAVAILANSSVSVLLGNSNGSFRAPVTYAVGYGPYGIVAGDFNGDGKPDLAVVNGGDSTVSILLNSGTGTFPATPTFTYSVGSGPYGISLIDFNKDGHPDLAVTNNGAKTISILQGNANGSFTAAGTYATGNYPLGTAVADLNGDGYADLIVWNTQDGTVGVLLNNKTGGFLPQVTYAVQSDPYSVAVADFNGDGFPDLAVANLGSNTVSVLLNDKTGKFLPQLALTYATGVEPTSVLARDMNGDGVLDLVVTNLSDGTVGLLPGKGDGTFLPQIVSSAGSEPYAAIAADFNGDGAPDLAVTNFSTNSIAILLQTPTLGQLVKTKSPSKVR